METNKIKNQLFHRIGDTFGSLIDANHFLGRPALGETQLSLPPYNLREVPEGYELSLSLPGFQKKEIDLRVEGNLLFVKAEVQVEAHTDEQSYLHLGFHPDRQERVFHLPLDTDLEHLQATYRNGILLIHIPKKRHESELHTFHIPVA